MLYMTPAQYVAYYTKKIPPKELCTPQWAEDTIRYNNEDILLAHFWVLMRKTAVPEFLQCDGWDTKKFLYA